MNGIQYKIHRKRPLIIVPTQIEEQVMEMAHDQLDRGHFGIEKTTYNLEDFYFEKKTQKIKRFIQTCEICQRCKLSRDQIQSIDQNSPTSAPFQMISLDFVGPLPITSNNNKYILTIVDHYSNWLEAIPTRETDAIEVLAHLIQYVSRHGTPEIILSDRGQVFVSQLIQQFIEVIEAEGRLSSPYHPEANGKCERMNRVLKEVLRKQLGEEQEWDLLLPWVTMSYNSTVNSTTGYSPYYILHGRKMKGFSSITKHKDKRINEHIQEIKRVVPRVRRRIIEEVKSKSDKRMKNPTQEFEVGEEVFYYNPDYSYGKFGISWSGPARIVQKYENRTYKLDISTKYGKNNIFNIKNLRRYCPRRPPEEDLGDNIELERKSEE